MGDHGIPIEKRRALAIRLTIPIQGRSTAYLDIPEPAFLILVLEHDIHHLLLVFLRPDAREFGVILRLVDDLDLFHNLGRKALDSKSRVFLEKGLTSHRQPVHLFSVHFDGAVGTDFDTRHLFQDVGKHRILDGTVGVGVEDKRILLDYNRIACSRYRCGVKELATLFELDLSEILLPFKISQLDVDLFLDGDIAQKFHIQVIFPLSDVLDDGEAVAVGQGEVRNDRIALMAKIDCCVIDRIARLSVYHIHPDLGCPVSVHHPEVLSLADQAGQAEEDDHHHSFYFVFHAAKLAQLSNEIK